jgi:ATP adenylyltransferase
MAPTRLTLALTLTLLLDLRRALGNISLVNDLKSWLDSLWAPWRVEYFERADHSADFLRQAAEAANDRDHLVVCRRKNTFLIMNRYPYSAGHLMVVPYRPVSRLEELTDAEKVELLNLACYAQQLLEKVVKAQGFNVGLNFGVAGGAGVLEHLHLHVVPRWSGDHNFMTVLGGVRIIPEGLLPLYDKLREAVQEDIASGVQS